MTNRKRYCPGGSKKGTKRLQKKYIVSLLHPDKRFARMFFGVLTKLPQPDFSCLWENQ